MRTTVQLKYLRIAPRKVRLVADLIRGKHLEEAETLLRFATKRAAEPVAKLLRSAIASAKQRSALNESNAYISKIVVNEGPKLKRFRARARGSAYPIEKKTSHITLVVEETQAVSKEMKSAARTEAATQAGLKGEGTQHGEKEKTPPRPSFKKQFQSRPQQKEILAPKRETVFRRIFRRKAI